MEFRIPVRLEQRQDAKTTVESATLRFFFDHKNHEPMDSSTSQDDELQVRAYASRGYRSVEVITTRSIPESSSGRWIDLDLTDLLVSSLDDESSSTVDLFLQLWRKVRCFFILFFLLIKNCFTSLKEKKNTKINFSYQNNELTEKWSAKSASLNVHVTYPTDKATNGSRTKRSSSSTVRDHLMSLHRGRRTECRGETKKCCRHPMNVVFKDIKGLDFIIQPRNFDAGYCKGRCPPRYNPANHHALLQSLIWKENRTRVPRPCCAPHKLADLEILYFDEDDPTQLKVNVWKDMKVLECACS